MAETPRYRVEAEGIVHLAYGLLPEDLKLRYRTRSGERILFVGYACDAVAGGRSTPPEVVSERVVVTCLGCLADTRHGGAG